MKARCPFCLFELDEAFVGPEPSDLCSLDDDSINAPFLSSQRVGQARNASALSRDNG